VRDNADGLVPRVAQDGADGAAVVALEPGRA